MTPPVRALVGVMTTVVFLWIAGVLLMEERWVIGGVIGVLGLIRAVVAVRQVRWAFFPPDDDA